MTNRLRSTTRTASTLFALASMLLLAGGVLTAQDLRERDTAGRLATYRVTVTNITPGQVFSPPLVVTHPRDGSLFAVAQPASDGLALLAEDGDNSMLASEAEAAGAVATASAGGPLPPGASVSIEVEGRTDGEISVVGMLVNTNDNFFALNGARLPRGRFQTAGWRVPSYDAGSEENNEDCAFIPGPACAGAGAGVRAEAGAEGFVFIGNGVHGISDLLPEETDWRNPVARVVVQRIR